MEASLENPIYTVAIATKAGNKYDVTEVMTELTLVESKGELAQRVMLSLANVKHEGSFVSGLFGVRDRVFVYADTGSGSKEVFRGFIWEKTYNSRVEKLLTYTCYDNLIYFMGSEDSIYFPAGKSTKAVFETLCNRWGISMDYKYSTINHPKLPLSGNLADIFIDELLDKVKKQTGKKYVLRSSQDKMEILPIGSNATIYEFNKEENAISTSSTITMSDMVTKVIITGKEDKNERAPVEATVEGNTKNYGTLQRVLSRAEGTTIAAIKSEANELIKEKGKPNITFSLDAVDIPWVRKGDKIKAAAGDMVGHFIVDSVSHDYSSKTMTMEVTDV